MEVNKREGKEEKRWNQEIKSEVNSKTAERTKRKEDGEEGI